MKHQLPQPWQQALDHWKRHLTVAGRSPRTIRTRIGHVAALARHTHTRNPADLTTEHIIIVYSSHNYSLEHRRGARTSINQFYQWAVKHQLAQHNPAEELPKVPEDQPRPKPAPDWLWAQLINTAAPRELLMIRLAGEAGLRREEIAKVHRDDVLWAGDGWALRVHGKGGKQRVIPINDRLAQQLQQPCPWIPDGCPSRHLFPSLDQWGNLIAPHLSADRVGRLISDLMPAGWSAHKLRHRYATRGYNATRNLRAVQEALGHSSVATTQRYTAVTSAEVRAVAEAV